MEKDRPAGVRGTDGLGNTIDDTATAGGLGDETSTRTINELPYELLIKIFSNLDPIQLTSLRLVCRHWNQAVQDGETWSKSFTMKFGTGRVFPSVTWSRFWMIEYFNRMKIYKKWNKGVGVHRIYQLINNEYGFVDKILTNFDTDKLLTFSKFNGNISISNLQNGKSQTFIPGNYNFTQISAYLMNWSYLVVGRHSGELYLKNLITSTSSSATRLSLIKLVGEDEASSPVLSTVMNSYVDKHKERCDIISTTSNEMRFWNLSGKNLVNIKLVDAVFRVKSDFRKLVVGVSSDSIYIMDFRTQEILQRIDHGLSIPLSEANNLFVDVDFGDCSVVLSYYSVIKVYDFEGLKVRELPLPEGVVVEKSVMQTIPEHRGHRDESIVGFDGVFMASVLSNDTVIVWNVRDEFLKVEIQCVIDPVFNKYSPVISEDMPRITAVALNSSVIVVGGYNGFCNVYNVFTGDYIKECSIKYPKKYTHMYTNVLPITDIQLNSDPKSTGGVIVVADVVQYFQFGENDTKTTAPGATTTKKKLNMGPLSSNNHLQHIKDQMEDYDIEEDTRRRKELLVDKYNGTKFEDEDEEMWIALAMSESYKPSTTDDESLRLAIELSKLEALHEQEVPEPELEEEQLRRILELSLLDQ